MQTHIYVIDADDWNRIGVAKREFDELISHPGMLLLIFVLALELFRQTCLFIRICPIVFLTRIHHNDISNKKA